MRKKLIKLHVKNNEEKNKLFSFLKKNGIKINISLHHYMVNTTFYFNIKSKVLFYVDDYIINGYEMHNMININYEKLKMIIEQNKMNLI